MLLDDATTRTLCQCLSDKSWIDTVAVFRDGLRARLLLALQRGVKMNNRYVLMQQQTAFLLLAHTLNCFYTNNKKSLFPSLTNLRGDSAAGNESSSLAAAVAAGRSLNDSSGQTLGGGGPSQRRVDARTARLQALERPTPDV